MPSDTKFLQPVNPTPTSDPNLVTNSAELLTYNYSQNPASVSTNTVTNVLLTGGLAGAILDFQATALVNPAFSDILSETILAIQGGASESQAKIESKVSGVFEVEAQATLSFGFHSNLGITAKEIDNPKIEYSSAKSEVAFLVLDISNLQRPKVLDHFAFDGRLISSAKKGGVKTHFGSHFKLIDKTQATDIDGNNGIDLVSGSVTGTYERLFRDKTQIAVVEINTTDTKSLADYWIGNLGTDVIYGTISENNLYGTARADKIYASLGNDVVYGMNGNDIIEGGGGNDYLDGNEGDDKIHGGYDNDKIWGGDGNDEVWGGQGSDFLTDGFGNDTLYGEEGVDQFFFKSSQSLRMGEFNIVADFQVGTDRLLLKGWESVLLDTMFANTADGVVFTATKGGKVLFSGVDKAAILSSIDFA
jgi:serralysin